MSFFVCFVLFCFVRVCKKCLISERIISIRLKIFFFWYQNALFQFTLGSEESVVDHSALFQSDLESNLSLFS